MIPQQPADPREPALGLQCSVVLAIVCHAIGQVAVLCSGSKRLIGILALFWVLFTIISYIVGSVWVRRCWANAELLNPGGQPFKRGWTTVGWLVPWLNIWMRWRIMLGLWRASGVPGAPRLVNLGFGVSLTGSAIGLATYAHNLRPAGPLVVTALSLVDCALFVVVVRRITARQFTALATLPAHPSLADPAPGQPHDTTHAPAPTPGRDDTAPATH